MSCHKLAFRTVEQAERTVAIVAALAPGKPQPVRLYECPECGLMHLTSRARLDLPGDSTVAVLPPVVPLFQAPPPEPTRAEREEALRVEAKEKRAAKAAEKARKAAAHAENQRNRKAKLAALADQPAWLKNKCREIASFIRRGEHKEAFLLANALAGLPARVGPANAEEWLRANVERTREWRRSCEPIPAEPSPEPSPAAPSPSSLPESDR